MGAVKRFAAFATGGLVGLVVGGVVSTLTAPQTGGDLRDRLSIRTGTVKAAGDAAQAKIESELIERFRADVDDPHALAGESERASSIPIA